MKMDDWVRKQLSVDEKALHRLNLEFDINLSEERLKQNPKDIQAVTSLGLKYSEVGSFEKALDMDLRLVELTPDDATAHYNLACSYAMLLEKDLAIKALQSAIQKGYCDLEWLQQDDDLSNLHENTRFQAIVDELRESLSQKPS